jgi:NADH-quinone oxidoreductase subunit N
VTGAVLSGAASLRLFAPEVVLAVGALLVLTVGLVRRETPRSLALGLAIAALAASALAAVLTAPAPAEGSEGGRALFGGLLARDGFGDFFTLLFAAGGIVVALASTASDEGRSDETRSDEGSKQGVDQARSPSSSAASAAASSARPRADRDGTEYAALLVSVVLGSAVMAKATDLLTAYLALEFVSLLSYVLAAFSRRSRRSAEAGLKYAIYGGVATAAMLYGFSWLYGLAGSTDLGAVRTALAAAPPLVSGMVLALVLAGLGFKMALVPFHSWCPDVYEGAPTPMAAFFSVVPKAAGFALAFRFLVGAGVDPTVAPGALAAGARLVTDSGPATVLASALAVVAMTSMTLGNLAAIAQRKLKRLLAYSSIAQAGTLAMALSVGTPAAERALLLYLGVYLFMNLAAFLAVTALVRAGEGDTLADVAGLGARAPVLAFGLTVALLSLAGLPPLGGFVAKFAMFSATIERGTAGGAPIFYVLAAAGVVNTVVSVYYYARVAKVMYFDPAPLGARHPLEIPRMHSVLVSISAGFVVALGIYVSPLASLVSRSAALWSGR